MNKVFIIGNLGQDPELRRTHSGVPVTTLSVATSDARIGRDGEKEEHTEWHRIVVWNKQAELCAQFLTKGRPVFIEGRLTTRSFEDGQGEKRYVTEIVAHRVQFLGARPSAASEGREAGEVSAPMPF